MIHVVAEVELKPGQRQKFLTLFKAHVAKVRLEKGCVAYGPMVDAAGAPMARHAPRENILTILEQWRSLEDLQAHMQAPHQVEFFKKTGDMRAGGRVEILQEA
jgi:quinol monooxygenase YgiN